MSVEILQVDAFTSTPFSGNPAAVCLLQDDRPDAWMQAVAAEMNLSETAFVRADRSPARLRWFTPTSEVSLCGHATLATAHALWETGLLAADQPAIFDTLSGRLRATRAGDDIVLDLPARPALEVPAPEGIAACLDGRRAVAWRETGGGPQERDWLAELEDEPAVRTLTPDFARLRSMGVGLIVTARARTAGWDFVSRYFAPAFGIDEDPVTGAAHCSLIPYWSARLGREELTGYQASARGGIVRGRTQGDRVILSGHAVTVLRGRLTGAAAG
jgi:predicted PhzF superfamily epimerase YddE/YHI9